MIDRRELIAAAGLAAPLVLPDFAGAVAARRRPTGPAVVLFDARFGEARRFADSLQRSGAMALETGRDTAALWYGRLQTSVRAHPGLRIAGLATEADFQVISGCAAEARLRLAHHAIHDGRGGLSHRVRGGELTATGLTEAGMAWPEALAASLAGVLPASRLPTSAERGFPGTLVSWMIT